MLKTFLHKDIVYIPTVVKLSDGGSTTIAPVRALHLSEVEELVSALRTALMRLVPTVEPLPRDAWKRHPMIAMAGAKSWQAFVRAAKTWTMMKTKDGGYEIYVWQRAEEGLGWVLDSGKNISLPSGTSPEDACGRLADIMRHAADRNTTIPVNH